MLFSNPFFIVSVVFGILAMMWNGYMDGAPLPPEQAKYNYRRVAISVLVNWMLLAGAIIYAADHAWH